MRLSKARYGAFNSWDAAKLAALGLMLIDHLGAYVLPHTAYAEFLRAIGRGAAPIFLFLTGFAPRQRFSFELAAGMLLLWGFSAFAIAKPFPANILATIILARALLMAIEHKKLRVRLPWEWLGLFTAFTLPANFLFEYGTYAFAFALAAYMLRRPEHFPSAMARRFLAVTMAGHWLIQGWLFAFGALGWTVSGITLGAVCYFLLRLPPAPVPVRVPRPLEKPMAWAARYTLYLYVAHLMLALWYARQMGYTI